jgi:hypothetical protein
LCCRGWAPAVFSSTPAFSLLESQPFHLPQSADAENVSWRFSALAVFGILLRKTQHLRLDADAKNLG